MEFSLLQNVRIDIRAGPTSCTPSSHEEPLFLQNIKQPVAETFRAVRTILPPIRLIHMYHTMRHQQHKPSYPRYLLTIAN